MSEQLKLVFWQASALTHTKSHSNTLDELGLPKLGFFNHNHT